MLGIPVAIPAVRETALAGAAILGARGLGLYGGLREAIEAMVRIDHRLQPDDRHRATYDALFDVYVGLWPAIRPVRASARRPARRPPDTLRGFSRSAPAGARLRGLSGQGVIPDRW